MSTHSTVKLENRIWDENERLTQAELRALQLQRLRELIARVAHVPFYRDAFQLHDISPRTIHSLDDIRRLPFTTKADLRETYPYGLFASPMRDVVRVHASSGTTGKPTVVGYTKKDIET